MALILALALFFSQPRYDLTKYDIFNFNYTQFFKLPGDHGILIQAKLENKLLVIDPETGALIHRLTSGGKGPGELYYPIVLGVRDNDFIVWMEDGRVMAFDFALNLLEDKEFRKLDFNVLGGYLFKDHFLLWLYPTSGYFLAEVSLHGAAWNVEKKLFPCELDERFRPKYGINYQTGVAFKRHFENGDDHYKIEAFEYPFLQESMILERPVDTLPDFERSRFYIHSCFKTENRYYASIVLTDVKYSTTGSWIDEWSENGTFIKRHPVPLDTSMVCIMNSDDVMAVSEGDMLYTEISEFLNGL